jgi:hypothetical protein
LDNACQSIRATSEKEFPRNAGAALAAAAESAGAKTDTAKGGSQ